jgi:hypothetical protein
MNITILITIMGLAEDYQFQARETNKTVPTDEKEQHPKQLQ